MITATETTAPQTTDVQTTPSQFADARVTLGRVIRSEWIKLVSLRTTWWAAGLVFVGSLGVATLAAIAMTQIQYDAGTAANAGVVMAVTIPSMLTVLLATILGTILITGEYSTGMIRSTLTAAPDRTRSLVAKATVLAGFMFVVSAVTSIVSLAVTIPIFAGAGLPFDLSDPVGAILPFVLNALYLTALALFGLGIGYAVRNGAGAIAVVAGVVFVLPIVVGMVTLIPGMEWMSHVASVLPSNAGADLVNSPDASDRLRAGIAVAAWTVAALGTGFAVLKTRDA